MMEQGEIGTVATGLTDALHELDDNALGPLQSMWCVRSALTSRSADWLSALVMMKVGTLPLRGIELQLFVGVLSQGAGWSATPCDEFARPRAVRMTATSGDEFAQLVAIPAPSKRDRN
jgi:hypothetical protein